MRAAMKTKDVAHLVSCSIFVGSLIVRDDITASSPPADAEQRHSY